MMIRRSNGVTVCGLLAVLLMSLPVHGDDYLIYCRFDPPGLSAGIGLTGVGAYVADLGVPSTWGDEIQYVYFLCGTIGYKYRVTVTNHGGPEDPTPTYIDVAQHPDHPDPYSVGPIEPRQFEYVSQADLAPYTGGSRDASGRHGEEFYVDSSGVYLGATWAGIHKWDHDWNYVGQVAGRPPEKTESLAYNPAQRTWYAGGRTRTVYQLRDTNGDGSLLDDSWQAIFTYPSYGGGHHDGLEYVGGALWISDMTSDVLGKWQFDNATGAWIEVGRFVYSEAADVEGMGFGPYHHFWIGGGWDASAYLYELGDVNAVPCVHADAGEEVASWPPNIPLEFDASDSWSRAGTTIALYEWDFDGDGLYDYSGTDPVVEHTYPAALIDANDPNLIDWDATAACYTATLRVTAFDPNGICPVGGNTDTDTRTVCITPPPWRPVADANGPYNGRVNQDICLDGTLSFHPAARLYQPGHPWYDDIVLWEWDVDNDGEFDDSAEAVVCTSWSEPGTYLVSLRVTDGAGRSDQETTTVTVGMVHDVAATALSVPAGVKIRVGDVVPVSATLSNLGDFPESFNVTVDCDDDAFDTVRVANLAVGANAQTESWWDTTGKTPGLYTIEVCADVVPGELRVTNNSRKITVEVVDTCILTVSSGAGGSVVTPGEGDFEYHRDEQVSIAAVPDDCFVFSHWTGTAVDAGAVDANDPAPTLVMDEDYTLEAHFAQAQATLTITSGEGGSAVTPGEGDFVFDCGASVPVEVKPDDHYVFTGWSGTAVEAGKVADPSAASTTVTVDADYTLHAHFALEQHVLVVSAGEGGVVHLVASRDDFAVHSSNGQPLHLDHGTNILLMAVPKLGYVFDSFTSSSGSYYGGVDCWEFILESDWYLTANFVPAPTP